MTAPSSKNLNEFVPSHPSNNGKSGSKSGCDRSCALSDPRRKNMSVTFALPASGTPHFVGVVAGSFVAAFLGGLVLIRAVVAVCRLVGRAVWGVPSVGSAPSGGGESLSAEKRKEIDDRRDVVIRRYLREYTMTLQGDGQIEQSAECCWGSNDSSTIEMEEQDEISMDEESGNGKADEKSSEECISLPLLVRDCDGSTSTITNCDNKTKRLREHDKHCAICHEEYQPSDRICRSSNSECTHIYHEDCIAQWLVSLGWMKKVQEASTEDGKERLIDFDLECPCCRREFVDKSLFDGTNAVAEEKV